MGSYWIKARGRGATFQDSNPDTSICSYESLTKANGSMPIQTKRVNATSVVSVSHDVRCLEQ